MKKVNKENQHQQQVIDQIQDSVCESSVSLSPDKVAQGRYDHILETFAEKYVQPKLFGSVNLDSEPVLSLGSSSSGVVPLWMNSNQSGSSLSNSDSQTITNVSLSLSPSEPVVIDSLASSSSTTSTSTMFQYVKEVEEGRQSWMQQRKEAIWRLSRLEQQLESEKGRKKKEKMEEIESKIRSLREEEIVYLGKIENECREQLNVLQKDAEAKEAKLMEAWCNKHLKLMKLVDKIGGGSSSHNNH